MEERKDGRLIAITSLMVAGAVAYLWFRAWIHDGLASVPLVDILITLAIGSAPTGMLVALIWDRVSGGKSNAFIMAFGRIAIIVTVILGVGLVALRLLIMFRIIVMTVPHK